MKLIESFQWVVFRKIQSSLPSKCMVFEGYFILICGFVDRDIKQILDIKCLSVVATENIYLLSFVALFLVMLRAAYLVYKYFFLHFSFFNKKTSQGMQWNI